MPVVMPRPGTRNARAFKPVLIAPQLMARAVQLAPLLAHCVTILDDLAVDRMNTGIGRSGASMGLSNGRGQREERSCQQELAHRILLQTGSLACDHNSTLPRTD